MVEDASMSSKHTSTWLVAIVCFVLGCGVGLVAGVLVVKEGREFVANAFRSERTAAVDNPIAVERPAFRFQHAGNWKVDVGASDYDPDHSFSVDTPGQSFMLFEIADAQLTPRSVLEQHVEAQTSKVMKSATRTSFTKWGAHEGEGAVLEGKLLGLTPGSIRIFCFRSHERTFTVIEQTYDEDRAQAGPGFALVERTFQLKEP